MAKINFNNLLNPVGSVNHDNVGKTKGNLAKRNFSYTAGNPAMTQIDSMIANGQYNVDDVSDLYDKAYQWEIDNANWLRQLEVDQTLKLEQRQYDSPVAEVARNRDAGINLDLSNSSTGSGSSGSASAGASMPDNTASIQRTDNYAYQEYVLNAVNTASNFIGNLSTSVSNILNSVSQMRVVPSHIGVNEATARLTDAQINSLNSLLPGQLKQLDLANQNAQLSNEQLGIANSSALLEQMYRFASVISPDAEDFAPYLTALGVSDDVIPQYSDMIRQIHSNPTMRDYYANANVNARWSEAEQAVYTQELTDQMTDMAARIRLEQQFFEWQSASLNSKIATILNTDDYAQQSANVQRGALGVASAQQSYERQNYQHQITQLQSDVTAFNNAIAQRAQNIRNNEARIASIRKKATELKRPLTTIEVATIERLQAENIAMNTLLSNEFYKVKNSFLSSSMANNYYNQMVTDKGGLRNYQNRELYFTFLDLNYKDVINHTMTPEEISALYINTINPIKGITIGK